MVEVSIIIPRGAEPRWCTWGGEHGGGLAIPPGTYRVRVSARGRDAAHNGEFAEEYLDFYLLQLWSAPLPDEILQSTSANAAYWHSEFGNQRSERPAGKPET